MSDATATEPAAPAQALADPTAQQAATEQPAAQAPVEGAEQAADVTVQEAQLPQAPPADVRGAPRQIDLLLDAPMVVRATLGETELPVRDVLSLAPGSVVKLQRQAGEPIDLYLRGVRFARAQLVVVGEQLGVRILDILSQEQLEKTTGTRE
jgi:flagellar motor switch protein FliN/FliY